LESSYRHLYSCQASIPPHHPPAPCWICHSEPYLQAPTSRKKMAETRTIFPWIWPKKPHNEEGMKRRSSPRSRSRNLTP
jgi:hypothetical protein